MAMNPDLDNLITVNANVQQDTDHGSVDLLSPFISALANSGRVSRLKLTSGNEAGVSLSLDGNHLMFDFSAYGFIQTGDNEALCYEYRINDAKGRYSQTTATITLSLNEQGQPSISTASLTTNQPFDYDPSVAKISVSGADNNKEIDEKRPEPTTEALFDEDEQTFSAASDNVSDTYESDINENPQTALSEADKSEDHLFELSDADLDNSSLSNSDEYSEQPIEDPESVSLSNNSDETSDETSDEISAET
ncbi:hypothetical protein N9V90_02490, partial [Endozoicomonas sp.]|nr:hypothetical protein [Endozoicomonas sp.]